MRTRACSAIAALCLLAGCSSADDLKSRWVELPTPPAQQSAQLPGPELEQLCATPTPEASFLAPIDGGLPAPRHLSLDGTAMSIETPEGEVELSLSCDAAVHADVDADGVSDTLVIANQDLDGQASQAALLITPEAAFYLGSGEEITGVSALDEAVSYTLTRGGYSDTVELGIRRGVPVRVDQYGGLPACVFDEGEIDAALQGRPLKEIPEVYPGQGPDLVTNEDGEEEETQQIPAYDKQPVFALPGERDGYVRAMFLLDGGDIHRWTDYRCGWIRADKVLQRETP